MRLLIAILAFAAGRISAQPQCQFYLANQSGGESAALGRGRSKLLALQRQVDNRSIPIQRSASRVHVGGSQSQH